MSTGLPNFHYFTKHVNREVKEVYWTAFLANLAITVAYIFEPIFLFSQGFGPIQILIFYAQVYFWYALLIFPATKIVCRVGYKHSIFTANIFNVCYWILLLLTPKFPFLLFVAPIFYGLQKSFYWPAYDSDVSIHSEQLQRGREIGVLFSFIETTAIIGPILGGVIAYRFGFIALFVFSSILMLVSVYPLFKSPEIYTRHRFHFKNFLQVFRHHPRNFLGYWGYAEDLMLMTLWPIVVYESLRNFLGVGVLTTIASTIAIVLMLYVGKLADLTPKKVLIQLSSLFYGLTWIFRFLATTVSSVFAFEFLTRTGKGLLNVPMVSMTYELAGSKGPDHAIAYSVFYEFSLSIGKIVTALLGILILSYTGNIYYVFILTGFLTLFYGLLRKS